MSGVRDDYPLHQIRQWKAIWESPTSRERSDCGDSRDLQAAVTLLADMATVVLGCVKKN